MVGEASQFWLYESGLGENRALLIENGHAVAMRIERHQEYQPGARAGDVLRVKLVRFLGEGRGIAEAKSGETLLIDKIKRGEASEGQSVNVRVHRAAIAETGRFKWALGRLTELEEQAGPSLKEYCQSDAVAGFCEQFATGKNAFFEHGWDEYAESAREGLLEFNGGSLIISLTPAMTLIDVDGDLPAKELAFAAAPEIASAVRLFDLQGNIGVDLPSLSRKQDRVSWLQLFDNEMQLLCERTAPNGFGFVQIVTRRTGPSVPEILQRDKAASALYALLNRAAHSRGTGTMTLQMHPDLANKHGVAVLIEKLAQRIGRSVSIEQNGEISLFSGQIIHEGEAIV